MGEFDALAMIVVSITGYAMFAGASARTFMAYLENDSDAKILGAFWFVTIPGALGYKLMKAFWGFGMRVVEHLFRRRARRLAKARVLRWNRK